MNKATERQRMLEKTWDNAEERERHQMTKSLDSVLQTWDFILQVMGSQERLLSKALLGGSREGVNVLFLYMKTIVAQSDSA